MALRLYKSYMFKDKDPIIDVTRNAVNDSKKDWHKIAVDSGVSYTTIRNWFIGETRRPQFATIAAVVRACGKEIRVGAHQVRPKANGGKLSR